MGRDNLSTYYYLFTTYIYLPRHRRRVNYSFRLSRPRSSSMALDITINEPAGLGINNTNALVIIITLGYLRIVLSHRET